MMTDKTMTLEQVRDQIKAFATHSNRSVEDHRTYYVEMNVMIMDDWWKTITRHLSQPAERGEVVAEVSQRDPYLDGTLNPMHTLKWFLSRCEDELPVGTKLYAAQPPENGMVPEGWMLVPVEPTNEMCDAAWESDATDYIGEHKRIWRADLAYKAMLSAAPEAPQSPESRP